ncbi:DUF7660 family protein [Gottfriedia solisilvae]|uniref:DUF7660 family protein n=1 Tax=Gottfriedia solisilvae TaxID=1516104 RepID=UPI003D2EEC32
MDISDKCKKVETKKDIIMFIESLRTDLKTNEEEWENITLVHYLEAIEAWMTDTEKLSEEPSWKAFANILLSGKFYE